jgi:hypothetical protein
MREGGTMKDPEIDRILSAGDEIVPSSGFAASVMEAVHREASAPAPIPFPWKRALPCIVLAGVALAVVVVVGIIELVQFSRGKLSFSGTSISSSLPWLAWQGPVASMVGWTVLALVAAFVSVKISMRLAAGNA